jgi:hypothetical protein
MSSPAPAPNSALENANKVIGQATIIQQTPMSAFGIIDPDVLLTIGRDAFTSTSNAALAKFDTTLLHPAADSPAPDADYAKLGKIAHARDILAAARDACLALFPQEELKVPPARNPVDDLNFIVNDESRNLDQLARLLREEGQTLTRAAEASKNLKIAFALLVDGKKLEEALEFSNLADQKSVWVETYAAALNKAALAKPPVVTAELLHPASIKALQETGNKDALITSAYQAACANIKPEEMQRLAEGAEAVALYQQAAKAAIERVTRIVADNGLKSAEVISTCEHHKAAHAVKDSEEVLGNAIDKLIGLQHFSWAQRNGEHLDLANSMGDHSQALAARVNQALAKAVQAIATSFTLDSMALLNQLTAEGTNRMRHVPNKHFAATDVSAVGARIIADDSIADNFNSLKSLTDNPDSFHTSSLAAALLRRRTGTPPYSVDASRVEVYGGVAALNNELCLTALEQRGNWPHTWIEDIGEGVNRERLTRAYVQQHNPIASQQKPSLTQAKALATFLKPYVAVLEGSTPGQQVLDNLISKAVGAPDTAREIREVVGECQTQLIGINAQRISRAVAAKITAVFSPAELSAYSNRDLIPLVTERVAEFAQTQEGHAALAAVVTHLVHNEKKDEADPIIAAAKSARADLEEPMKTAVTFGRIRFLATKTQGTYPQHQSDFVRQHQATMIATPEGKTVIGNWLNACARQVLDEHQSFLNIAGTNPELLQAFHAGVQAKIQGLLDRSYSDLAASLINALFTSLVQTETGIAAIGGYIQRRCTAGRRDAKLDELAARDARLAQYLS